MPQTIGDVVRAQLGLPDAVDPLVGVIDTLGSYGYEPPTFEPRGREWAATSMSGPYRAQALGPSRLRAAQNLVRVVSGDMRVGR